MYFDKACLCEWNGSRTYSFLKVKSFLVDYKSNLFLCHWLIDFCFHLQVRIVLFSEQLKGPKLRWAWVSDFFLSKSNDNAVTFSWCGTSRVSENVCVILHEYLPVSFALFSAVVELIVSVRFQIPRKSYPYEIFSLFCKSIFLFCLFLCCREPYHSFY